VIQATHEPVLDPPDSHLVFRLRGDRMARVQGVFDEFARALKFPAYFGANWNALEDCLWDLSWLDRRSCLLVVSNARSLLLDDAPARATLLDILSSAGRYWSDAPGLGRVSFKVLLVEGDEEG
jgi:hypothetical protein